MRRSPWPVILLLVALAAYFVPMKGQTPLTLPFAVPGLTDFGQQALPPAVPKALTGAARQLFERVRPASVQIEQLGNDGTGGLGSGFFISSGGLLLTAYHVVDGARIIRVRTVSNQVFPARVVGFDNAADVALLQIDSRGTVPFLALTPQTPEVGESVLAVGNSGGDFLQPRRGRLLRLDARAGNATFPQDTLEMSAPLAPGDSGGPIVDSAGQAIGIVSYVRVDDAGNTITSYAVPVTAGEPLLRELRAGVKRDVPAIGLSFDSARGSNPAGGVVAQVVRGSPAARAGLRGPVRDTQSGEVTQTGDVVTAVDGVRTRSADDVIFEIRRRKVGDTVQLTVDRDGQQREASLRLVARGSLDYRR